MRRVLLASVMEATDAAHQKIMDEGGLPPADTTTQPAKTPEQLAEEAAHEKERGLK